MTSARELGLKAANAENERDALRAEIKSHKAIEKSLAKVAESRRQEILEQDDLIATLRAELAAMKSLERDGDWPSYPELALMFTEQGAELAAANKDISDLTALNTVEHAALTDCAYELASEKTMTALYQQILACNYLPLDETQRVCFEIAQAALKGGKP